MDLKKLALGMVAQKLGGNNALVGGVMDSLLGGGNKMDIGSLVGGLKEKGLGDVADSWLGAVSYTHLTLPTILLV